MLSMTAVRMTLEHNHRSGVLFAAGAASVVFVQGLVAALFVQFLTEHPEIITGLKKASILILIALALFFFYEAKKAKKIKGKNKAGKSYLVGMAMSSLNQLAIPFYLVMATMAETKGWLEFTTNSSISFAFGTVTGTFFIFYVYISFAKVISKKNKFITQNINYILSAFFLILSAITATKLILDMV